MFQAVQTRNSGYTLVDKGYGFWQIRTPSGIFTGSLKQVCAYSVNKLGFLMSDIELGVMEMEKAFHSAAEYGIMKSLMWTYDLEENDEKITIH